MCVQRAARVRRWTALASAVLALGRRARRGGCRTSRFIVRGTPGHGARRATDSARLAKGDERGNGGGARSAA
eukprot:3185883-Pleurochrysis_carterae.AAC.1